VTHPRVHSNLERESFLEDVAKIAEAVFEFHELWEFNHEGSYKGIPDQTVMETRIPMIKEEVKEWEEAIKNFKKDPANFDEEVGDLLWVTIGNLLAIQNFDSRTRVKDLVIAKNATKNKDHYAIRRDTNKLISIHKPQKWIGAETQMREEWESRGLVFKTDLRINDDEVWW
jgi:NTP pyrophosphatase (non-canonical NTP hydrolase)